MSILPDATDNPHHTQEQHVVWWEPDGYYMRWQGQWHPWPTRVQRVNA